MGDAGPLSPTLVHDENNTLGPDELSSGQTLREINVLVTGFGPFKTFTTNPSYLITSALPTCIDQSPLPPKWESTPARRPIATPNAQPYRINLHTYPTPVRVAYGTTATTVPRLVGWSMARAQDEPAARTSVDHTNTRSNYDYVLHIGMAGGRDNYSLETIAHRDHYKIKDVDDRDGFMAGEFHWKQEGLPERFDVGWDKEEVLARWEWLTGAAEDRYEETQMVNIGSKDLQLAGTGMTVTRDEYRSLSMVGKGRRAVVKLSKDAGRFLCEFILYTSLSTRFKEAAQDGLRNETTHGTSVPGTLSSDRHPDDSPAQRIGKVAFLHVPGAVGEADVARGVRVAEAAILALVSSWEDGYRNPDVYTQL